MLIVNCVLVLLAIQVSGELQNFESELSNIVGLQNLKDQLNEHMDKRNDARPKSGNGN